MFLTHIFIRGGINNYTEKNAERSLINKKVQFITAYEILMICNLNNMT